jgi:hypothetical protein
MAGFVLPFSSFPLTVSCPAFLTTEKHISLLGHEPFKDLVKVMTLLPRKMHSEKTHKTVLVMARSSRAI